MREEPPLLPLGDLGGGAWENEFMAAELDATHLAEYAVEQMRQLARSAIASGRPLSWYEALYSSAAVGTGTVPWDHREAMPVLVEWL